MENINTKICPGIPHFCSAGTQAPQVAVTPVIKSAGHNAPTTVIDKQNPWSVFGEVYWI